MWSGLRIPTAFGRRPRNGKIIVTTCHPEIGDTLTEDAIALPTFTPGGGRKCILNLATWPGGVSPDPVAAEEFGNELGGLSLGIVHMTALIRARKTPRNLSLTTGEPL